MLQLVYILAFTIIAFLAVSNLIKSLITVGMSAQRYDGRANQSRNQLSIYAPGTGKVLHPELLDDYGNPINEPLLVVRSVSVEDARQKLDALFDASPSHPQEPDGEN